MSGLYLKQLFGTDRFVILTEADKPGHLTRLDDKGTFSREQALLFTAAPDLLQALKGAVALSDELAARNGWERVPEANEMLSAMRAAIAKAEGRS